MRALAITCLFVAACGGDDVHHLGDAPPAPDASIDAATSGPVSLRLTLDDAPVAGINVYFQDAASGLVATVATGADGIATATMEPGGYVTVVQPFLVKRNGDDVRTFAGVKPGDQLRIDERSMGPAQITITLTLPIDVNANTYDVYTSCSGKHTLVGSGGSATIPSGTVYLSGCTGGLADVLVQTTDGNGAPLGWFYHPDLPVTDLATITLTDTYATTSTDVTMMFSNIPADYTGLAFRNVTGSARGPVLDLLYAAPVTAGVATQTISRPPVTNATSVTAMHPTPTNSIGSQFVVDWGPASVVTFDLAGALLPLYATVPTYAIASHAVSWTAGTGVTPDFVVAEVYAERFTGAPNTSWRWRIVAPYATTITLPVLPAPAADYNIVAGDGPMPDGPLVDELTTAKVPGGYDAVRARLHSLRSPQDVEGLVTGAAGRIVYEMLESQLQL